MKARLSGRCMLRNWLTHSRLLLTLVALGLSTSSGLFAAENPIKPSDKEPIPVAFLISDGAVVIDFCGPWEVFQDAMIPGKEEMPFHLYTVADTKKPIRTSGGM